MILKATRFVNLVLVALTLGLAWAHVLEHPGKLRLDGPSWLRVQHNLYIAFGPPVGAKMEVAAIVSSWIVLWLARRRRPAAWWTLVGAVLVTAALAEWAWLVAPMNTVLNGFTADALPATWTAVRDQWEFGHATHTALFGGGFCALLIGTLADTS